MLGVDVGKDMLRAGHIAFLYSAPAYARRGVASALYRRVESAWIAAGVRELRTEASLLARPFFERHGFDVVEEQTVRRGGVFLRRYAMRKSVPCAQAP